MEPGYTLAELSDLAGVSTRTVRYYVAEGLLRSPGQGSRVRYDEGHLARLRLIRRLQLEHLPLAEIRNRLRGLTDADVRSALEAPASPEPAGTAVDYVRSILAGRGVAPRAVAAPTAASVAPSPTQTTGHGYTEPGIVARAASVRPGPDVDADAPAAVRRLVAAPGDAAGATGTPAGSAPAPVALAPAGPAPVPAAPAPAPSAALAESPEPDRSHWERIVLGPDVELHVRRPLSRLANRHVSRLLDAAREILREEAP